MTLLAPYFLIIGLLAIPILAFHMRQRSRTAVGSLMLWRRLASADAAARHSWQRPEMSWPLVLQLAALAAFALALAQPVWNRNDQVDHAIYVIDGSVDMQAPSVEGNSMFATAVSRATHYMQEASNAGTSRFTVIVAGVVPDIAFARQPYAPTSFGTSLEHLSADDGAADWSKTSRLIQAVALPEEATQVILLSWNNIPGELAELDQVFLEHLQPSTGIRNSFVSAAADVVDAEAGTWKVEGKVTTNDPEASDKTILLRFVPEGASNGLDWGRIRANPPRARSNDAGAIREFTFRHEVTLPGPGMLLVEIDGDDMPVDDVVRLPIGVAETPVEVLYIGSGEHGPAYRAAASISGASVERASIIPDDAARFDLIVVDGMRVAAAPPSHTIWIGAADLETAAEPGILPLPDPSDWRSDHVLGEGLHWAGVELGEAYIRPARENAVRLLGSDETSLIEAWTSDEGRQLRFGFSLENSNLSSTSVLPSLFNRFARWSGLAGETATCTVGLPCSVDARLIGGPLTRIDGDMPETVSLDLAEQVRFSRDGRFVPVKAGLYQIGTAPNAQLIAVNAAPGNLITVESEPARLDSDPRIPVFFWRIAGLLACILLVAEAVVAHRRDVGRKTGPLLLRAATCLIVIGCLLLPALELPTLRNATVVLRTSSAPDQVGDGDHAVVLAGPQPRVLGAADTEPQSTAVARMGESLLLAGSLLPPGESGRLVVYDDGVSAAEDYAAAMDGLKRRSIQVDHVGFVRPEDALVNVERVEIPALSYAGDDVTLSAIVSASAATEAELALYRDRELLVTQPVKLERGHNRIETVVEGISAGRALFSVVIKDAEDGKTLSRNGVAAGSRSTGPVAILSTNEGDGRAFAGALAVEGMESQVLLPSRFPAYLREWLRYRAVVLLNIPARTMTAAQQELLETSVRDHGLGAILVGGDSSFGPGGYLETPIDRLSPLSSDIPGEAPEAALIFVLDRSGSMQQPVGNTTRLDIAKQATFSAIQRLNPRSSVGVVVFDDSAQVVVPLEVVSAQTDLQQQLSSFGSGGGTAIYPGLVEAFSQLGMSDAAVKHVVVMTDGLTQPGDFETLLADMREQGITVSTVAIGGSNVVPVVERIARLGGGNFHTTTDFASLPSILAQEATLFSAAPVEEGTSRPSWSGAQSDYLELLPAELPPIEGFVLTSAKPGAQVELLTPDNSGELMPLLARWRYGNGQVMALTTDATGAWSRAWQELEGYSPFWAKAIRHHLSPNQRPGQTLQIERHGDEIALRFDALDRDGLPERGLKPQARIGSGREGTVLLHETDPGLYRGTLPVPTSGTKTIIVEAGEARVEGVVHVERPARLYTNGAGTGARALSFVSGGETLDRSEALAPFPVWVWVQTSIWQAGFILALAIFLAELFFRYFAPSWFRYPRSDGSVKIWR